MNLYKYYKKYNKLYFDNLLPKQVSLKFAELHYCGHCSPWEYEIEISSYMENDRKKGTLLHEMLHFWQYHVENKQNLNTDKEWHDSEFVACANWLEEQTGYEVN